MVPPPVAQAIGEQILISLLASTMCSFMLTPSDWEVWVKGLVEEGFVVVLCDRAFDFARGRVQGGRRLGGRGAGVLSKILADA
jgi:hypothetical protein